jgi:hypothetical protein
MLASCCTSNSRHAENGDQIWCMRSQTRQPLTCSTCSRLLLLMLLKPLPACTEWKGRKSFALHCWTANSKQTITAVLLIRRAEVSSIRLWRGTPQRTAQVSTALLCSTSPKRSYITLNIIQACIMPRGDKSCIDQVRVLPLISSVVFA